MLSSLSYTVIIIVLVVYGYWYTSCTVGLCACDRQTAVIMQMQQLKSSCFTYPKITVQDCQHVNMIWWSVTFQWLRNYIIYIWSYSPTLFPFADFSPIFPIPKIWVSYWDTYRQFLFKWALCQIHSSLGQPVPSNTTWRDSRVVSMLDFWSSNRGSSPAGRRWSRSNRGPVALCTLGLGLLSPPS